MPERITPRVGLLPLILELYDEHLPELRTKQQVLVSGVQEAMSPFCSVSAAGISNSEAEVCAAVERFEADGCDAVVVLFVAYAPSLIAAEALVKTPLPVVIFNTQVSRWLDRTNIAEAMLRNHGMHGVQDLASVMLRAGKAPHIVTGHFRSEEALAELEGWLRACALRRYLGGATVGIMGGPFEGMGDFQFDEGRLLDGLGVRVAAIDQAEVAARAASFPAAEIEAAVKGLAESFTLDERLTEEELAASEALSAGVLGVLAEAGHCAWSMNFLDVGRDDVLRTVPFLAASRSMQQGYGYAGEGDAMGALAVFIAQQLAPPATFTEMFSMDPATGTVLMSHMGEGNYEMAAGPVHLVRKEFLFGDVLAPAAPVFAFRAGEATLVNLIDGPAGLRLIAVEVTMEPWEANLDLDCPQGFMRPGMELGRFLTAYSELGGSHHLALCYGRHASRVANFATLCGLECFRL